MLYYKGYMEYQMNHPGKQQNCFVLIISFLSLPLSISGKGECNNKGVRSNTFFFLLYLEEYVFKGSSTKENDWPWMYTVSWSRKGEDLMRVPFTKEAERRAIQISYSAAGEISFNNQAGFPSCPYSRNCEKNIPLLGIHYLVTCGLATSHRAE